jgi:hypothetical protein
MRLLPVISTMFPAAVLLAACSSTAASAPAAAPPSSSASQSCASTTKTWLHGGGGTAFHAALSAGLAMRVALESGSPVRISAEAQDLNSAARRADGYLPPACANPDYNYQLAMGDWMISGLDAMGGDLKGTSSRLAAGAKEIDGVTVLQHQSSALLKRLSRKVVVASATPTAVPAVTSAPPTSASPAPVTSASCYPLSDEGTCYEPGEFCRDSDHGTSGVAGDGEAITCEDNDGWRWEPT